MIVEVMSLSFIGWGIRKLGRKEKEYQGSI